MRASVRRGRDYTPLFRFLLKSVGRPWSEVHSEAVGRLDTSEPIGWLVATSPLDERPFVLIGESSYYSGLRVADDGTLALVQSELTAADLPVSCGCCTHTFNGAVFGRDEQEAMRIGTLGR